MTTINQGYGSQQMQSIVTSINKRQILLITISLYLILTADSLQINLIYGLLPYTLSEFKSISLLSLLNIINNMITLLIIPLFSILADCLGRNETLLFSILIYVFGSIISSTASNFMKFLIGFVLYSIGSQTLDFIKSILFADLTKLGDRGLINSLQWLPFTITSWLATLTVSSIQNNMGWRYGYLIPLFLLIPAIVFYTYLLLPALFKLNNFNYYNYKQRLLLSFKSFDINTPLYLMFSSSLILLPLILIRFVSHKYNFIYYLPIIGISLLIYKLKASKMTYNTNIFGNYLITMFISLDSSLNWQYFMLYFMIVRKMTATESLLLFKGYQMGYMISSIISSILIKKHYNIKNILVISTVLNFLGILLMIPTRNVNSSIVLIVISQSLSGIGQGALDIANLVIYQGKVSPFQVAKVNSHMITLKTISSIIGLVIANLLWTQLTAYYLKTQFDSVQIFHIINDIQYIWSLNDAQFSFIVVAFSNVQLIINSLSCLFSFAAVIAACLWVSDLDLNSQSLLLDGDLKHVDYNTLGSEAI